MRLSSTIRIALRSLQRAPIRSALTALSIAVGVAAVVATASIGAGAKAKLEELLRKPETRLIFLQATVRSSEQKNEPTDLPITEDLRESDYLAIRNTVRYISAASPRVYLASARVNGNGRSANIVLDGIDVGGFTTNARQLLSGLLFSRSDVKRAANVCVISQSLAAMLYPEKSLVPGFVHVNGVAFSVIGVVDDIAETHAMFGTADLHVYIPYTSLLRRINGEAKMVILIQAADISRVRLVQWLVDDLMEQRRSGRRSIFLTNNALESLVSYTAGALTVGRLLAVIGAIALIVGGIGIMNVMLISVTERAREIGLRKAIGTRHRDILQQFTFEAVALALLGGAGGVALGWGVSQAITRVNGWPTDINVSSVFVALICSVAVGLAFGYHPAQRAASLSSVDALRME
jgi:putative ABC transport system permease protein